MRSFTVAALLTLCSLSAIAQTFHPDPNPVQDRIEKFLKRYGTIERVYLADEQKKIFEAKPGKEYFAWVTFESRFKGVRRMMLVQQGVQGEKVKIHYTRFNQAISDGYTQAYVITLIAPGEAAESTLPYRVDASKEATIYIYELTRGFKRDL